MARLTRREFIAAAAAIGATWGPLERSPGADGGPLRYRVVHRVPMWRPGERPRLEQRILEGDPGLAL